MTSNALVGGNCCGTHCLQLHQTPALPAQASSARVCHLTYPDVTVAGVGPLTLPCSQEQAGRLKAVAQQAPHGKGLRTVVDTAVRDAYQVRNPGERVLGVELRQYKSTNSQSQPIPHNTHMPLH